MYADKYASRICDIPKEPHWAILKTGSIYVPGDERSRTNPGHGYPASTEYHIDYEVYLTREKWVKAVEELEFSKIPKEYVAVEVNPAKVTRKIDLNEVK